MLGRFQWGKTKSLASICVEGRKEKGKRKWLWIQKKQIKCSFIISEEYKLYNKNTSSKDNWEYSKSFTLACCNVTWSIQWKRDALNGPLHFSNSNSTFCVPLSPIPQLQICTAQKKKKRTSMEGSKKILQSAHTTGPPYSLFQSHFIRLKEYWGCVGVMMLKRKCFSQPYLRDI